MEQIEFNLLREPWIRVMRSDCGVETMSLPEALIRAREFRGLAGELPTQDVAIQRLLLAVMHTVFSRVDADGASSPLETRQDAYDRWKSLWDRGSLPEKPIRAYLAQWEERFWLFHPEHPFYQLPAAEKGTEYGASKLNGEISESSHKTRLFPMRTGSGKQSLSYDEAARWLVCINGFDDSSTKVCTGTGAGWLGRIGNIYAVGADLFETLMLNLTLLKDGKELWEEENVPYWERPFQPELVKREIAQPMNQAELLTLQSRRLLLRREDGRVTGYCTAGGDYFSDDGAVNEQLTLWRITRAKSNQPPRIIPRRHQPDRQMWRDFGYLAVEDPERGRPPGIVLWINALQKRGCLGRRTVRFQSVGARYDSNGSSVIDVLSDQLDFHADLLNEVATDWVYLVRRELKRCEEAADIVGRLADGLCRAAGGKSKGEVQYAREQLFYRLDLSFRRWLMALDPSKGMEAIAEAEARICIEAYEVAVRLGTELVRQAGQVAFAGREVMEKVEGKEKRVFHASPKEFNSFRYWIGRCFDIKALKEAAHE